MPPQRTEPGRKVGRAQEPHGNSVVLLGPSDSRDKISAPSSSSISTKKTPRRSRPKASLRPHTPSASTSSNAAIRLPAKMTASSMTPKSTSQPKRSAQTTTEGPPPVHPLNVEEMTEFPFPPQGSAYTPTLSSPTPTLSFPTPTLSSRPPTTSTPNFTFPEGRTHTPSSYIANLLSNWNAFTPSPGSSSAQFGSQPDLQSLVSPEQALSLSDLIREEFIDTSPSQPPPTHTPTKLSPIQRAGFGGLRLTPAQEDDFRILNAPLGTSPFSPAYQPGKSLFSPRSVSNTDPRPALPIPQRQLSWSQTASAHLQAQTQGGRRFSVPNREATAKPRKASYTDPRSSHVHPLSRSLPPQRRESLPSAGLDHPHLDDVFAPQYKLAGLGLPPLPSSAPLRPFRYPLPSPPAAPGREFDESTFDATLGQSDVRLTSETAMRYLTDHHLPAEFTSRYSLRDELGVGGFGFVCSALVIEEPASTGTSDVAALGSEVAVKFIFKDKMGRYDKDLIDGWPVEAYVLQRCHHQGIIQFHEVFEDEKFFYLVQELHGDPWDPGHTLEYPKSAVAQASSVPSVPNSPPRLSTFGPITKSPMSLSPSPQHATPSATGYTQDDSPTLSRRPIMGRRASHDLFEAVEHQRFSDEEARRIFSQIADAVGYLHHRQIYHRDLKDENIVIDRNLQIKIVDFGSAVIENTKCPPILYDQFRGTLAYASAEILRGDSYHAGPADIWSLGILLSILFTGESPFPDSSHARQGKIKTKSPMPSGPLGLMKRCLLVRPEFRITIDGMRDHYWLAGTPKKPLKVF